MGGVEALRANETLRRRTITALSLVPLVVAAVLWLPTLGFATLLSGVLLLAAWEWCGLAGLFNPVGRIVYLAAMALAMLLLWYWPQGQAGLVAIGAVWWLAQGLRLLGVRTIARVEGVQLSVLPSGLIVLLGLWSALVYLHALPRIGTGLVLFLMFLMWTADSMAYFVGRAWGGGRARLAPALSPGKTRVGVYGALAGSGVCGLIFAWTQSASLAETLVILLVCAVSVLISVVGDLYESLLKRRRGLKDSGQLLPGHGGLLDRIDSLSAAAPVFSLGIILLGAAV